MWLTDWLFGKPEPPGWAQDFVKSMEVPSAPPVPRLPSPPVCSCEGLVKELEKYKRLYKDSQYNEQLLARRIGVFKHDWPDIHKRYFTHHGEAQRAAVVKTPSPARKRK